MATKLKVTAIQDPSPNNGVTVGKQLKESVEVAQRLRGDPMDSYVRVSELIQGGQWRLVNGVLSPISACLSAGVRGDILYYNGTSWVTLPAGPAGQTLHTAGPGADPYWA